MYVVSEDRRTRNEADATHDSSASHHTLGPPNLSSANTFSTLYAPSTLHLLSKSVPTLFLRTNDKLSQLLPNNRRVPSTFRHLTQPSYSSNLCSQTDVALSRKRVEGPSLIECGGES